MKAIPLAILLLLCTGLVAQPVIDSTYFPQAGTGYARYLAFSDFIGEPGPDRFYDFSMAFNFHNDSVKYVLPSETPFADEHPGAEFAMHIQEDIFHTYYYFISNNGAFIKTGYSLIGEFGFGWDTLHYNFFPCCTDVLLGAGITYGYSGTAQSYAQTGLHEDPYITSRRYCTRYMEADGWGILKIQTGEYENALRIKYVEYSVDSVFEQDQFFMHAERDTQYYYHYYVEGFRHPVVIAHTGPDDQVLHLEILDTYSPPVIFGCTDPMAANYNSLATQDDGSCWYCDTVIASVTADTGICRGDAILLEASGGNHFIWSTGDTVPQITVAPDSTIVYGVYTGNLSGCYEYANMQVTVFDSVHAGFWINSSCYALTDTVLFINTSTGAESYEWFFNDTINGTGTERHPRHVYSTSGEKSVVLIAANPCSSDTAYLTLFIQTGMEVSEAGHTNVSVYPNPGQNATVKLSLSDHAHIRISLHDLPGRNSRVVFDGYQNKGTQIYSIGQGILENVYFITIETDKEVITRKWVKISR
ncbi:MAG: T9SS type A sorting domain-containing protein [Bacteroidetes bacterium]|nr:T9SS type A sorting domain-containing protein [Bacteroidota bacterium]